MTDVLNESTGMSWISKTQIKQFITSRKFDDPFKLKLMVKDINIAVNLAEEIGLELPLSFLGRDLWEMASESADEESSISEMVKWVEDRSGTII
jgi:3-hydroxyisobutyrate dehydrogenase